MGGPAAGESSATMEAVSVGTPDEASRQVELQAGDDGVAVTGAATPAADVVVVIPWSQAVAIGRRIIELARARGDLT
jgi:hypothetical protein